MKPIPSSPFTLAAAAAFCLAGTPASAPASPARPTPGIAGTWATRPAGPGPGRLEAWHVGAAHARQGHFGHPGTLSGNSFRAAYNARRRVLYVPTLAGRTYEIDPHTLGVRGSFRTLAGGRIARVTPDGRLLLVLSAHALAGYATGSHHRLFKIHTGGHALAIGPDGDHAYVGGIHDAQVIRIALPSGRAQVRYPIAHVAAMALAGHKLFCANMKTGVVTALNIRTGERVSIQTPEVDPDFSYRHIAKARAGLMQMAVGPEGRHVYAAGFSGHILVFSVPASRFDRQVSVSDGRPDKLSGLAVVDHGRRAVVTDEKTKTTLLVNLHNGRVLRTLPGVASNRWITL
ncbi:MAG TPA: hypothetical protein VKA14_00110 [Gammaproteobacteria bacterium]|nr:hypothetical protein [Gammaproteobacteria bacterium]